MATQNQYRPNLVTLAGGLDFVTPKLAVEPGKMIDGYNFEVADRLGYKRIDGIEPFDGRTNASLVYSNLVYVKYEVDFGSDPGVGEHIKLSDEKAPGIGPCARLFSIGTPAVKIMAIIVTDYEQLYKLDTGVSISTLSGSGTYTVTGIGGTELLTGASYDTDAEKFSSYVATYSNYEDTVTHSPSGRKIGDTVTYNPITSMKWYKDRLYITQDCDQLGFDSADAIIYANDYIEATGGATFQVLDVKLIDGSYVQGDGAGILLVRKTTGSWPSTATAANLMRNGSIVGTLSVASESLSSSYFEPWMGGLWRTKDITQAAGNYQDQGWEPVDQGFVFDYKEGDDYGTPAAPPPLPGRTLTPTAVPVNTATSALAFSNGSTPFLGSIWTLQGGATDIADAVEAADGVKFVRSTQASNYGNSVNTTISMSVVDLDAVPEDAVLLGLEVTIRARATPVGGPVTPQTIGVKMSTTNSITKNTGSVSNVFADYVLGGPNDLWGSTSLSMDKLRDQTLEIKVAPNHRAATLGVDGYTTDIDQISLKVYYQVTVDQLFFWNGTDDVTATLVNYSTDNENGLTAWTTGDAKGQMHIKNILPVGSSVRAQPNAGDEIRTAAGGLGDLVAIVESEIVYAGVPSFEDMQTEESLAQIIVANFYGIDDWEAMYAVSGAGRAWTYDDYYFRYIYTGLPISKDKPRHVEFFKHHLCLGYKSGNVSMSVEGEPLNFSGTDGAVAFDLGDRVTGFVRLQGDVLGVACQSTWQGIQGATIDDFTATTLSPYEGAQEYTVVDAGGRPIYCSATGISTFDQTAAYGNFLGSRLSDSISPWLLPRLSGYAPALQYKRTEVRGSSFQAAISKRPRLAYAVRRKNQYRLVFEDGYVLTMTLFGNEQIPIFTLHQLYDGDSRYDSNVPLVPFAWHVSVDSSGAERVHMASYSTLDDPEKVRWCYEVDKGWLFRNGSASNTIHGNFTLTNNNLDDPLSFKLIRKIRVHGMTKGRGQYKVCASGKYVDDFPADTNDPRWQPISLPRDVTMGEYGASDYYPSTDLVDYANNAVATALKFQEMLVDQPPVIFQTLILQSLTGKGDI